MTDKDNKKQLSAWFALFTLTLLACTAFGIFDLAENETLAIQVQFMSGETDKADANVTDNDRTSGTETHRAPAVTSPGGISATENPHVISDACLPDTLHGPPGPSATTV